MRRLPLPLPKGRKKRIAVYTLYGAIALFVLAQAVPYGRGHSNPPVTKEPGWDSAATRALVADACFDCHSNLTTWPWYSNIAPNSWLIQRDVDEGRSTLNFSEWDKPQEGDIGDIAEVVNGGSMPPWYYRLLHAKSRLSSVEKKQLVAGLQKTFQASPPIGGGG